MPDYSFEPVSKLLRALVLSPYRQSGWGTQAALPDGALTRVQRFDGSAVIDMNPGRRSDKNMSGKGSHWATNSQLTMWDLKISGIKHELSDWSAGWILSFCLGKDIISGSGAPYTHTITFDESTRKAIPTTFYMQDADDLWYKIPDLHIVSATFTIPETGAISVEYDVIGTGILLPYQMILPAIPNEIYLMGSDCVMRMGDPGTVPLPSLLGRHLTTTLKVDWQSAVHRAPGGGLFGLFIRKGDPKFSLSSTVSVRSSNEDVWTRLINDSKTAFSLLTNSGAAAQFGITLPANNLKATKMSFQDDMSVWNIETDETTAYLVNGVQPITTTVVNNVPSYLGAYVGNTPDVVQGYLLLVDTGDSTKAYKVSTHNVNGVATLQVVGPQAVTGAAQASAVFFDVGNSPANNYYAVKVTAGVLNTTVSQSGVGAVTQWNLLNSDSNLNNVLTVQNGTLNVQ